MDMENIMQSEINQRTKKHHRISLIGEPNEQAELTRKLGTDSQMESRMTPSGEGG